MGRASRRKREGEVLRGPLRHQGAADQIAGARWARRSPSRLAFFALPWPVWASAALMVGIGVWAAVSAWLDRDPFGLASVIFFGFAVWIARKAPRERTIFDRESGTIAFDEGFVLLRTRARVAFADIRIIAVEYNRMRHLFRVVALVGDDRYPVGRGFVTSLEASQRLGAIAEWLGDDGPTVDRRLEEEDEDEEDDL